MMAPLFLRRLFNGNRFLRFCVVGGIGFTVDAGGLLLLITITGMNPFLARLITMLCAITVTWLLNRSITFRSGRRHSAREWLAYTLCVSIGAAINYGVYSVGLLLLPIADMHLKPLAAVVMATAAAMLVNYNSMRLFVFRTHAPN